MKNAHSHRLSVHAAAIAVFVNLCLVPCLNAGQTELTYGEPEDVGMSSAILEGAVGAYREAVERDELVGAVLLVARHGKVVLHEAVGWSDQENQLPMAKDTLFHMASNTKPVVATAIAMMAEAGELRFEHPVRRFFPEWDNYKAGFITIDQLLSHTSGLRIRTLFLPDMDPGSNLIKEAKRFGTVGAYKKPGNYSYSNPGFNTLAAILEQLSKEDLESHLDSVIYTPLGMNDSYNYRAEHALEGKRKRLGPMYYTRSRDGQWQADSAVTIPFARGSGGMISTAWDYAIFLQTFLNGGAYGEVRLLKEKTVTRMTRDQVEGSEGYGYGWVTNDGADGWKSRKGTFSHSGSDGTDAFVDLDTDTIGLVFTQTPSGRPPFSRFQDLVRLAIETDSKTRD